MLSNKRRDRAENAIADAVRDAILGFKRVMRDYPKYSDEYDYAKHTLRNHDDLVDYTYQLLIYWNSNDLRFCGKNWLCGQISAKCQKFGY